MQCLSVSARTSRALVNLAGWHEALTGALAGGAASGLFALAIGPLILRLTGLPFIMVTLGIGAIVYEAANKAVWLTGGDNGLPGVTLDPLFGVFRWSVFGQTGYLYVLGWLLVLFYLCRRIVASPFGMALQGVRENPDRMRLVGAPVLRHLVTGYVIASTIAGIAGALSAQTNAFVGLEVLSLNTSIDGLVMLVLGGVGRLYGGLARRAGLHVRAALRAAMEPLLLDVPDRRAADRHCALQPWRPARPVRQLLPPHRTGRRRMNAPVLEATGLQQVLRCAESDR